MEKNEKCLQAIIAVMDIFGNKWSFFIIHELCSGPKHYNQLRKGLHINTKSLSDTLKHFEENGIISRSVIPTIPVTVEYALTEKGHDFDSVLTAMYDWRKKWS